VPPHFNGTYSNGWINIIIKVTYPDGITVTLGPYTTDATRGTATVFTPNEIGNYTLQSLFSGETLLGTYYEPSSSNIITLQVQQQPIPSHSPSPTPTLPSPNLSFYCISSTTSSGFNVQIQGSLAYNGVGLSGDGIPLSDSVTGGATWQDLAYVYTDDNGSFSVVWTPLASGNDIIKATWSGDNNYSSVSAVYNFAIAPFNNQNQNVFSVTSNSTLTSLTFDSTTNSLSFGVSGVSGTTGVTQICVPQSLIPDIAKLNVMLDGSTINYNSLLTGNVWIITFAYHHSSHTVVMALASTATPTPSPTPFPTWIILTLFAAIILLSMVFVKKRMPKNSSTLLFFNFSKIID
jgi:hypothetical protein